MEELKKRFHVIKGEEKPHPLATRREAKEEPFIFEEVLIKHLDAMYTAAVGLTKDKDRAQDLIQDVCLRAFKSFRKLKSHENLKGWLFKILMNTFIDQYRSRVKEPELVDLRLSESLLESSSYFMRYKNPSPEEIFFSGLVDEDVRGALDTLHVDFKTVVWLSDVEGFSQREIAEMLGCPIGTIASRLFRGRSLLREALWECAKKRGLIKE